MNTIERQSMKNVETVGTVRMVNPFKRLPDDKFTVSLGSMILGYSVALIAYMTKQEVTEPGVSIALTVAYWWVGFRVSSTAYRIEFAAAKKTDV